MSTPDRQEREALMRRLYVKHREGIGGKNADLLDFKAGFYAALAARGERPVCGVCGDEKILMEADGSKAQPCYACQPVGTTLEQASRPYVALREDTRAATHVDPSEDSILAAWQRVPASVRRHPWLAFRAGLRARKDTERQEILKQWKLEFAGGMLPFDNAYWAAKRRGATDAEANRMGVEAILRAALDVWDIE